MFSLMNHVFRQAAIQTVQRGALINLEGNEFWLVEQCQEQGANMIVKCVGEDPLTISKDRIVSVRSYR